MRRSRLIMLLIFAFILSSILNAQEKKHSEIMWDKWGVPHISGNTDAEVFYGFGWAQMEAHGNLILKAFGKSRGLSAEYWGGDQSINSDRLIRKLNIPNRAQQWYNAQTDNMKLHLSSFVAGMNDYCEKHPEVISEELKIVLPIRETDPLTKLQVSYHLMVGAFAMQPQAAQWKNAGSDCYWNSKSSVHTGLCKRNI